MNREEMSKLDEHLRKIEHSAKQARALIYPPLVDDVNPEPEEPPLDLGEWLAEKPYESPKLTPYSTGFEPSRASMRELEGVNQDLVTCTLLAMKGFTTQDFRVFDGIRTIEEQRQHVKNGASKTMQSKHLDGLAVDLVPIINGILKWDWEGCYKIAMAMDSAATHLGIAHRITWGGAWDRTLADFGGDLAAYKAEVEAYKRRNPGPDFIDGPHFQITKE